MTTTSDARKRRLEVVPAESLETVVDRLVAGVAELSQRIDALEQAYGGEST